MIHSYPKVYTFGHPALDGLRDGPVSIEEKIDGSQFSFGVIDGELCCRSKNQQIILDAPQMFDKAIATADALADQLIPNAVYRAEYLAKPKHNTLAYERVPTMNLILFDIETEPNRFLSPDERDYEAARLGLESVPRMFYGELDSVDQLRELLDRDSILGNCKIEGVVAKNHARFGPDKKMLAAKHVSEAFKEKHNNEWRKGNPTSKDIIQTLIDQYATEARWAKAVQHLREVGTIEGTPKDIGALMKEAQMDFLSECEEEVKEALWKWAGKKITRGITKGLPQWYKDQLLASEFED